MSGPRSHRDFAGSLFLLNGTWNYEYRLPGAARPKRERLGASERHARKRARQVTDVIDQLRSRLITLDEAARLLDEGKLIGEDVKAYERFLRSKGVDGQYVATTLARIREGLGLMNVSRTRQVSPAKLELMVEKLRARRRKRGDGKPGGAHAKALSSQTIQHFVRALKQFTRRMKKMGRLALDPLADVDGVRVVPDPRRDAGEEEVRWLVKAAEQAPVKKWNEMRGPDRRMLYVFAWATGLRAGELRAARTSWLKLDGSQPSIDVPGEFTKNGKPACQPLPRWLADAARAWLNGRTGQLFPRMPGALHRMFQKDRAAARQLYLAAAKTTSERETLAASNLLEHRTPAGLLVFHSLRHGYVSIFATSDTVPARLVQELARHGDVRLTMNRYAHVRGGKKSSTVEQFVPNILPPMPADGEDDDHVWGTA